jgi:hypothetical protein
MSPQNTIAYTDLQEARNAVKTKMAKALIEIKNMQVRPNNLLVRISRTRSMSHSRLPFHVAALLATIKQLTKVQNGLTISTACLAAGPIRSELKSALCAELLGYR